MDGIRVGGIMQNAHLAKIGVLGIPDRPGTAGAILSALGEQGINVQFIVQCIDMNNQDHIVLCVDRDDLEAALEVVEAVKDKVQAQTIVHRQDVAMVSIFGPDFRQRPGIAGTMFNALASVDINILAISTSISTVSCIIDANRLSEAVQVLENTFEMP